MERNDSVDNITDDSTNEHRGVGSPALSLLKKIPLTKEYAPRIEWLWDHLKTQDYWFDDMMRGSSQAWLNRLTSPNSEHFEFGDDGYVMVDSIVPSINANIHFAVWGKPQPLAILAAGRELFEYLFTTYKLNRLTAMCPVNNQAAIRMAVMLRFRFEGELRRIFLFHGKYYNVSIYGLLRDEFHKREVVQ